ncbi:MAG: glutamate 5-kinase, partial [Actinomycetota bacterium]|nr:glutamate 5-kinase [Actinomycetota bacterium]
ALAGEPVGTWIVAQPRRLEARRLWIGFALNSHGRVHVDRGAVRALVEGGTSLLAVGVKGVEGGFSAGDAVEVVAPDGTIVARGLINYDAVELERIAGRSTAEAAEVYGSGYAREVIHRDNLVVFASVTQ